MKRAIYASAPDQSRGRLFPEEGSAHRSPFQRDRDRIIHSSAFRRLKHKTQVFVEHEGDYFRTRLTHSIEVGQVGRTIAGALGLDIDLTEAVALAHDLGHTPFGHTGEDALHECIKNYGGFDHNAQALKIVTSLENHYADFDGLNLTWETLEGIAKHNGPVNDPHISLREYNLRHDLELQTYASAEAQVAALADDIAYNNHDLDDGLRAGVFSVEQMQELPIIRRGFDAVDAQYSNLDVSRRRHEALRRVFGEMVEDVLIVSRSRLAASGAQSADDIRALDAPVIQFSDAMLEEVNTIRKFLFDNMYRHWRVRRMRRKAAKIVTEIFDLFMEDPYLMPPEWNAGESASDTDRARLIADYIAGMTDRFALQEYEKLMDPKLRGVKN